jgi:RimJ/RimL family protein N-acetyltransferase
MISYALTEDAALIGRIAARAFDRPEMLRDGADAASVRPPAGFVGLLVIEGVREVGAFAGIPAAAGVVEVHAMLGPECRGRRAVEASRMFLDFLGATTVYRRAVGYVPEYNRPMLRVAHLAGMRRIGWRHGQVMKDGRLRDEVIFECEL